MNRGANLAALYGRTAGASMTCDQENHALS